MCQKLKALKQDLKLWNKEVFGHVGISKQDLLQEIAALDAREESHSLSDEEKLMWDQKRSKFQKAMLMKEISWRQKSRVLCPSLGAFSV